MKAYWLGALLIPGLAAAQELRIQSVTSGKLEARLRAAPDKNEQRQAALEALFREAGCADAGMSVRRLNRGKFSNVVCTLAGKNTRKILVGGHFDRAEVGQGVIDNWSGATLVAAMIEALGAEPREHTFEFVGFAREEEGLVGSREFAQRLKKPDAAEYAAMVNLDSLALGPPVVWKHRSTPELFNMAELVAQTMKIRLDAINVEQVGESDSRPFLEKNIKVIDFHSLRQDTFKVLHSPMDNFKAVRMPDYEDSFRLIANFLAYIDLKLP